LASNTENVIIQCKCSMGSGGLFKEINWYTSDKTPVDMLGSARGGAPYTHFNHQKKTVILIIPKFIDEYSDTYICSSGLTKPHRFNRATIDLTLCA